MIKPSRLNYNVERTVEAAVTTTGNNHVVLMNTLSTFFPEGEQFFVRAVRSYRDTLIASGKLERGSALDRDISTFIGHEAFHTIAHDALNNSLYARGYADPTWLLQGLLPRVPKWLALQATCVLEHYTDLLARLYFSRLRSRVPAELWELWDYHAREEIDHRHVAISVASIGPGVHKWVFVPVSLVFLVIALCYYVRNGGGVDLTLIDDLSTIVPSLIRYGEI